MPHIHHGDAKQSRGDKLEAMTGRRGEYPPDRAARIAGPAAKRGQGDSCLPAMDAGFTGAPARQVSNTGDVKGEDD